MAWQLVVVAGTDAGEDLASQMWNTSTLGVELLDLVDDAGTAKVEVRASFSHRLAAEESLGIVEASYPAWIVEVPDDAGLDAWRPFAKVERAGVFSIRPSWLDTAAPADESTNHGGNAEVTETAVGDGVDQPANAGARGGEHHTGSRDDEIVDGSGQDRFELLIDPGRTFGSGSHESTKLALELLGRLAAATVPFPRTVLDVGTGSGILAIAAVKLGARSVVALDIDPLSPAAVTANAVANGVGDFVWPSTDSIDEISLRFDLVIANILSPTLIDLGPHMVKCLNPSGRLIMTGFLVEQEDAILAAFGQLSLQDRIEYAGWSGITMANHEPS